MRVAVRVGLGVVAGVLGGMLLLGLGAGVAVAAPSTVSAASVHGVVGHHAVAVAPTTSAPSAGTGTNYNQGQQAADAALAKRKLIMAAICVVLLVIVYFGHRAKYKHVLRVKNLQNAKS